MKLLSKSATILFDWLLDRLALLTLVLIGAIWVSITGEVTLRTLTGRTLVWVTEITEYCLLFITFLSAAWLLRKEGHVRVDILLTSLNPASRALLNTITYALAALACLVLFWFSAGTTWSYFLDGTADPRMLELPRGPLFAVIPIGSFLLFVQFLRGSYGYLAKWKSRQAQKSWSHQDAKE